jgi:hypothetical protein
VRLETSFSKWLRKVIFLVCIAYVNFIPKRQSNNLFSKGQKCGTQGQARNRILNRRKFFLAEVEISGYLYYNLVMEFNQITDTPPHIQELLIEGYRRMSPQQKLKRVDELTKAVQQFALARIRRQYGDISEREQKLRLASLWLDRETMIKVFDWDPSVKGY